MDETTAKEMEFTYSKVRPNGTIEATSGTLTVEGNQIVPKRGTIV